MPMRIVSAGERAERPTRAEALRQIAGAFQAAGAALALLLEASDEPAPRPADDPMLTVPEAALEIRRSASFVRAQCRLGRIKSMRDANGYRIRRSALTSYERKRTA
jgi:hypothetical protein